MRTKKILPLLLAALVVLGACGSDAKKTSATGSSGSGASASSSAASAHKIVSLSATATEMLFAIGAGKQVVAVDDQSNFPAEAPKTDLSAYTPNVEAISTYKPDLVVISGDTKDLKAGLEKIGVKVLVQPAAVTIDDTYKELQELGDITGHRTEADAEVASIKQGLADAVKDLPARTGTLTYYHELDNTLYTVTSKTFIGSLYAQAKLENVADAADPDGANGGYPQLSAEYLVQADPDLVFLADTKCCQQDEAAFAARPGFAGLRAVARHHVIPLDDDIASRWGPRVVDLLESIVAAVKSVPTT
jgi:iron complex transport system substrate-binding protein